MVNYSKVNGGITAPQGFLASGVAAGIKRRKPDMALIYSKASCTTVGVFTQNRVKAAPLLVNREHLEKSDIRAVIINSGVANACTGSQGLDDAHQMTAWTANELGIKKEEVLVASTGVIGTYLPMEKVKKGIEMTAKKLEKDGEDAAQAIMTTDVIKKEIAVSFKLKGKQVTVGGMAKGSGMIHPNMATMLGFITTDISIEKDALRQAFKEVVDKTFNMITVDGDTSTNDMALVLANGLAGNEKLTSNDKDFPIFQKALEIVCTYLARAIAKDGEGATKLLEVRVKGAKSIEDARKIAKAVAKSNLVKTAIFGEDPNWGRIICAAGYSGAQFDPETMDIFIKSENGVVQTTAKGAAVPFDREKAGLVLKEEEIIFELHLDEGVYESKAWSCDFSYDYIRINSSYGT